MISIKEGLNNNKVLDNNWYTNKISELSLLFNNDNYYIHTDNFSNSQILGQIKLLNENLISKDIQFKQLPIINNKKINDDSVENESESLEIEEEKYTKTNRNISDINNDDMEEFLNQNETKNNNASDNEGDIFEEFKKEDEKYNINKSKFKDLEKKLISEKDWDMRGEVLANQRPANALLDSNLEFDSNKKITKNYDTIDSLKQIKETIESVIIQRIKDNIFDDRDNYSTSLPSNKKNIKELNFEKSSKGLDEIYENEYKSLINKLDKNVPLSNEKLEILKLFEEINVYLNNLSELSILDGSKFKYLNEDDDNAIEVHKNPKPIVTIDNNDRLYNKDIRLKSFLEMEKSEKKILNKKIKKNKMKKLKKVKEQELKEELKKKGISKEQYDVLKKNKIQLNKNIKMGNSDKNYDIKNRGKKNFGSKINNLINK